MADKKNNFKHIVNKKLAIFLIVIFVFLFFIKTALATWDGNPYSPGSTINPECLPTQTNCDVSPLTYTTDNNGLGLAGNIFSLNLDGTTLSKSSSGLKISDNFVSNLLNTSSQLSGNNISGTYNNLSISGLTPLNFTSNDISQWNNGAGYITSYTETDPLFATSTAHGITGTDTTNWNTAFGWGNHATAGYLTGTKVDSFNSRTGAVSLSSSDVTNALTFTPYNATNPAGYITSYTETDPLFATSTAHGITGTDTTNWNTAFGWGNHADAGYLKSGDNIITSSIDNPNSDLTVGSSAWGSTALFSDGQITFSTGIQAPAITLLFGGHTADLLITSLTSAQQYNFPDASGTVALTSDIHAQAYPGAGIAVSTGSTWGSSITDNSANWNTAFGWGNHALAGYLTGTKVDSFNSRTGPVSLSSTDVTNALTFTPYNATNPASYITSAQAPVQSVAGRTNAVTLSQSDISGLTTASSPTFAGLTLNGNLSFAANTFTTSNTTVVTNLNADLLDGNHADAFALSSALSNYIKIDQTTPQTIGTTGNRLSKLWATDLDSSSATIGSLTGLIKGATGSLSVATAGTDYQMPYWDRTGTQLLTKTAGDNVVIGGTTTNGKFEAIASTSYAVPLLTANNTPAPFTVSASTENGASYAAWKAFDGSNATAWITTYLVLTGTLKIDPGVITKVYGYTIVAHHVNTDDPRTWIFEGSATGAFTGEQTTLDTQTNVSTWTAGERRTYTLATPANYRYYRLNVTANQGTTYLGIAEFNLVGDYHSIFVKSSSGALGINTPNPAGVFNIASSNLYPNALVVDSTGHAIFGKSSALGSTGAAAGNVQVFGSMDIGADASGIGNINFWSFPLANSSADAYIKIQNYLLSFGNTAALGDAYSDMVLMQGGTFNKTNTVGNVFDIKGTINNSGTAGYNALNVDITQSAVGSGANNLANFKIGGVSKATINNAGTYTTVGADYAEYFATDNQDLTSGELVCSDTNKSNAVKRCDRKNMSTLVGIISTHPSVIGNSSSDRDKDSNYKVVALLGQVPGFVNTENGEIRVGDYLTTSSKSGVAMKTTDSGKVIGTALENYNSSGVGSIKILVNPQWYFGSLADQAISYDNQNYPVAQDETLLDDFTKIIRNSLAKLGLGIKDGVASIKGIFTDKITTKELCVDDTCIDSTQLKKLLENNQPISPLPPPDTSGNLGSPPTDTVTDTVSPTEEPSDNTNQVSTNETTNSP